MPVSRRQSTLSVGKAPADPASALSLCGEQVATTVANLFARNSVFVGTVFFGAFAFGITYDKVTTAWWDSHNRGKQWADIRDKYLQDQE
ncbi:hypothetical protein JCM8202_005535 [Rhodotorula sphaerocarpa]